MALSKMRYETQAMDVDLENAFNNEPISLNDDFAEFGDLEYTQSIASIDLTCPHCNKDFSSKSNMNRHLKIHHSPAAHPCLICLKEFTRPDVLAKHMKIHDRPPKVATKRHAVQPVVAPSTTRSISSKRQRHHVQPVCLNTFDVQKIFPSEATTGDLRVFLDSIKNEVKHRIQEFAIQYNGIKWYISACVLMVRLVSETEEETHRAYFRSKCTITLTEEIPHVQEAMEKILKSLEEFQGRGSGWIVHSVEHLELMTAIYQPLAASSYIPLPKVLASKQGIINVKNEDNKCLVWSVLAALHPVEKNPQRVSKYQPFEKELNTEGITFPTPIQQIERFEKLNKLTINIFGYEEGEVLPLRVTSNMRGERHINLLLISDGEKRHYCLIKNMSRLLYGLTKHHGATHYCPYCLHRFTKKELLDDHILDCRAHGAQKIKMPEDKWLRFNSPQFQLPVPFTIYADFESILVKRDTCLPNPVRSATTTIADHIPSGFCYCIVGPDGEFYRPPIVYHGENAVDRFLTALLQEEEGLTKILNTNVPAAPTHVDQQNFDQATNCHICRKPLNGDKVLDHDHLTGRYRGAAHNTCNLNFKFGSYIPVVMHNLRGYDSHLIMQGLGKCKGKNLSCIPNNSEKFISFSVGNLRFIDSLQFLNASLEKLVANLELCQFKLTKKHFGVNTDLMLRKGVFPYEYIDSFSRFNEKKLPTIEDFFSHLTETDISDVEYAHAQKVWNSFGCKDLGDYQDVYVCSDVVLLADVFQNFRQLCFQFYGLDPAHFYTAPGLAWQAALKMSGVMLELLQDPDQHLFIERGIRGGIAMISHRHAQANNKYIEDYDPSKPSSYITYLDANNLYGWAMSQYLPTHGFQWAEDPVDYMQISDDSPEGYILEVDMTYPAELHDSHNEYPLAPEHLEVSPNMLSPYIQDLMEELNFNPTKSVKLVPNLRPKTRYVVHYRNLKLYTSLGLQVTHIHRVLKFKQSPWLASYITFNTEQRKIAKTPFEKDLFKLLNNAVFGKTMENLRNRVTIGLVNSEKRAKKLVASPTFHSFKIITEDLASIERKKTTLTLNRPIYVGFSILDLSKTLMYEYHYAHMKHKYGHRAKLLFTDTDSLCYQVDTNDLYKDMNAHLHLFDTSEYPHDHPLYSVVNKKVIGKFKDELAGEIAHEFVGLKPKMYSLLCGTIEKKTAKGVAKSIVRRQIRHADYKRCLFEHCRGLATARRIASHVHRLQTVSYSKTTLCPIDTKRYISEDGVSSLAYGHFKII